MTTTKSEADDFCQVTGPCNFTFPRDHGSHPGYRTEWWYYTGNLETPPSRKFGFQLTFFRSRILRPGEEKTWPSNPSAWRTPNLFLAHAALSDIGGKRFLKDEKASRGAAGLAGVSQEGSATRVFLGPWSAQIAGAEHTLTAAAADFSLQLTGRDSKGPVAHGRGGYSRKGEKPESSSCYYSIPRLEMTGTLNVNGEEVKVSGTAWMDHEFSSAPLEPDLVGWDWFSIQLGNRTELMIYMLRLQTGQYSASSSGSLVDPSGRVTHLTREDFTVEVLDRWKSPASGAAYPSRWRITVPSKQLELTIAPNMANQELVTSRSTQVTYWEGSVSIQGKSGPEPVAGVGYVELTGYAKKFELLPTE